MQASAISIPDAPEGPDLWLAALPIQEGQHVERGQLLARVETKTGGHEINSPSAGYVVGLHAVPGQIVHRGHVLCYICSQPSIPLAQSKPRAAAPEWGVFDPTALIIFGGGGHGKTVIDLVRSLGTYRICGIIDDMLPAGSEVLGAPVLGGAQALAEWHDRGVRLAVNAIGGIGNAAVRVKIFDILASEGFSCPALVHPSAVVERSAVVEAGAQIFAQTYVGSAARIGFGSVVNAGAIVHHDCVLGRVVNLSPGATLAGNVRVEDYAQIGMLATVNLKITIGEGARLGNGCTVKADVPAGGRVYAGAIWPARKETTTDSGSAVTQH